MQLFIVTGMSGSGKSKALDYLEDAGFYCLDNLPVKLLPTVIEWIKGNESFSQRVALTIDIRNHDITMMFDKVLETVHREDISMQILFLDCENQVLLKRYKESRRLHPLMNDEGTPDLLSAIEQERKVLAPFRQSADYVIDTSMMATSALRERILDLVNEGEQQGMLLSFVAFGYKYGLVADADVIFDVRCLPNPFYVEGLRGKTGLDKEVRDFVMQTEEAKELFARIVGYLDYAIPLYEKEGKGQLVVGIGCTGGQHRSLTFAWMLKEYYEQQKKWVRLGHRDLETNCKEIQSRSEK